jgi:hypothetical protein
MYSNLDNKLHIHGILGQIQIPSNFLQSEQTYVSKVL